MKRFFIFALVATVFAACSTDATQDLVPEIPTSPDELYVSFAEEDTRIQLQNGAPVWTEGDLVSVFYRSNAHDKYQFTGETGDTGGTLKRVSQSTPTMGLDKVIAVYPYNENYLLSPLSGNIKALLPAEQTYLADSYGVGSSLMVSSSKTDLLYLKNVCGWLKLQFTGEGSIEKIVLRGNCGEQVAGDIYICSDDASCTLASDLTGDDGTNSGDLEGTLVGTNTILTELTLNCGEGVALNSKTPTSFYIALPPQTFEKGVTIDVLWTDGSKMTKSVTNSLTIERNHIVPMASIPAQPTPPADEIWYTSTENNIIEPYNAGTFGTTIVSNTYENGKGIIKFNGNVTEVGYYAFAFCNALKSINIPDSVTSIGYNAFYECKALKNITIPDSITTIETQAFKECDSITSVNISNLSAWCKIDFGSDWANPIDNKKAGLYVNGKLITDLTVPSDVSILKPFVFKGYIALTKVTIPNSVTSIGNYAFRTCTTLKSVTIGSGVTSIGVSAFYNCSALTSVNIPNSVTSIGNSAFYKCKALTSVTIGNGVTSIGGAAFNNCDAITSVNISDLSAWCRIDFGSVSANPMDNNKADLYLNGELITDLTIPSDITQLKPFVFKGCNSITKVTIPNNISSIGESAFKSCSALKEVYCKPTTPPTGGSYMFDNNASDRKIYVPTESVDAYKAASGWSDYASDIEPYNFTE